MLSHVCGSRPALRRIERVSLGISGISPSPVGMCAEPASLRRPNSATRLSMAAEPACLRLRLCRGRALYGYAHHERSKGPKFITRTAFLHMCETVAHLYIYIRGPDYVSSA